MSLWCAFVVELRKTVTLPATFVAVAVAGLGSFGITLLNAVGVRNAVQAGRADLVAYTSPVEAVFSAAPLGTVGAVILGVVAVSSEYRINRSEVGGGRQIAATLTAIPRRVVVLVAKIFSVVLLVLGLAAVTLPVCLVVAHSVVGTAGPEGLADTIARSVGVALYWVFMALMALAVTVVTRSGIIPLIVFIANSSLVSVSLLLSYLTPLARYLPDLAGVRLFARDFAFEEALAPLPGGLVMAAWAVGLLVVSTVVFTRRDA
jgi:ABC-2 type transport system permease protein